MVLRVTCECGAIYSLPEQQAGKEGRCVRCGKTIRVPSPIERPPQALDPAFDRDRFLLHQKALAVTAEKYFVFDENGNPLLYVERPYHVVRTVLAVLAGVAAGLVLLVAFVVLASVVRAEGWAILLGLAGLCAGIVVGIAVGVSLSEKRHVTFFRDASKQERVLDILQHKKFQFVTADYTVRDAANSPLALLRKNYIYDFLRKRWHCYRPSGELWFLAKEDSLILSLLRRYLGPLFGVLRTNFVILDASGQQQLGQFNRKFTILDRYVLDMSADPERQIDRRVAVALGVMLDTGERR